VRLSAWQVLTDIDYAMIHSFVSLGDDDLAIRCVIGAEVQGSGSEAKMPKSCPTAGRGHRATLNYRQVLSSLWPVVSRTNVPLEDNFQC